MVLLVVVVCFGFAFGQQFPCGQVKLPLPYPNSTTTGSAFAATSNGSTSVAFTNNTNVYNIFFPSSTNLTAPPQSVLVGVRSSAAQGFPSFSWSFSGDYIFYSNVRTGAAQQLFASSTVLTNSPRLVSHSTPATASAYVAAFAVQQAAIPHTSQVVFSANPDLVCVTHLFSNRYSLSSSLPVQLSPVFAPACSGPVFSFATFVQSGDTVVILDETSAPSRLYKVSISGGGGTYLSTPTITGATFFSTFITSSDV
jgi:hypothetical protein